VIQSKEFSVSDQFDVIVIGAGPGGYVAAIRAAQLGFSVACVEKRTSLGGTCLNIGCIPSKAMLDSSELYALARQRFATHGIKAEKLTLDLAAMLARKDKVVKDLTGGVALLFKRNKVTPVYGQARLAGSRTVAVVQHDGGEAMLEARNAIILATGSTPIELPFLKFNGNTIVSSTEALSFDKVPGHLVVVGGGYIGLELSSVWNRLGARVSVVEFLPRIVPVADGEMGQLLFKSLQKQGIEFHLETKVTGAKLDKAQAYVKAETKEGKSVEFAADRVLVSVGRKPYIEGLGLAEAGVNHDVKTGMVSVDDHFQTSVPGIYAIGDLIRGPMLAHKAEDEGVAVAEILAGKPGHVNYQVIPSVIYTWPELASVGQTEEQLKEQGVVYHVGKFPFIANGRARAMDEVEGTVKVLADARTDRVLGVHIFGPRASDMIAEAAAVMEFHGSSEDIARTCHSHPTLSEALKEAALAVEKRAIHI
jgi:dihydrolipoamide dehydrogenase